MKKTVITSTLALGLGVTGAVAGHSADAAEQNINKADLANKAQHNPEYLNEHPVHSGAYNYNFKYDKLHYDFESNGTYWSWKYGPNWYVNGDQGSNNQTQTKQVSHKSVVKPAVKQEAAPQTKATQQPKQTTTKQAQPAQKTTNESASTGSSVYVNSHLQQIAQRESRGNIHAINPSSGAAGKYQFLQSTWDSVAPAQYKGVSPANAPESVQDAAAMKLYNTVGPSQWVTA